MRYGLALACLATLCGAALARDLEDATSPARGLLQTTPGDNCGTRIPGCQTCRFQFSRGTVTRTVCTQCAAGYTLKQLTSGSACYCAPGYYATSTALTAACVPCDVGYYCAGQTSASARPGRAQCITGLTTTTKVAASVRECVAKPGYSYPSGNACGVGTYNPGYNQRTCTACPAGLTSAAQAKSVADCVAPKGYYYLRGKAVACAKGTYKDTVANKDCTPCDEGITTTGPAKTDPTDCNRVMPGYEITELNKVAGTASLCHANSYASDERDKGSSVAVTCTDCTGGLQTAGVTGAKGADACLAPPGYKYTAGTPNAATACGTGMYKPGYDRQTSCFSCSSQTVTSATGSITTAGDHAADAGECYTASGYGNYRDADGALVGIECPQNTYGRGANTYGLVDVECTKCPEHTHTAGPKSTAADDCKADAGYGWYDGIVQECDYGEYSPGGTQDPCTSCGLGYNSTKDGSTASTGVASTDHGSNPCMIDFGWTSLSAGVAQCRRGYYKSSLGAAACSKCADGKTTLVEAGAVSSDMCNACLPGFGSADPVSGSGTCAVCASGTYAAGYISGTATDHGDSDPNCQACAKPYTSGDGAFPNGNSVMVSPMGASTPEQCVPQFPSEAGQPAYLTYDYINMPLAALTASSPDDTTLTACQTTCANDNQCEYFVFYTNVAESPDTTNHCFRRRAGVATTEADTAATIAWPANPNTTETRWVLFEIGGGQYVAFPRASNSDAVALGDETLFTTIGYTSFDTARADCDKDPRCIGMKNKDTGSGSVVMKWFLFAGAQHPDVVAKYKAYGPRINPWVARNSDTRTPTWPSS